MDYRRLAGLVTSELTTLSDGKLIAGTHRAVS